jgi:transcription initiation factor TFIIIB Brf1 subunit/transcription initiation factor TFIIB
MSRIGREASKKTSKSRLIHSYPKTRDEEDDMEIFANDFALSLNLRPGVTQEDEKEYNDSDCKHIETICKNGIQVCQDCGAHVYEEMDQDQEWRYYGDNDNKNSSDPSRCQYRKIAERGIRKDLEKLNIPTEVINIADDYYFQVTKGEIKRATLRKGIMFACVFEAYKDLKKPHTPDTLSELFDIDRKTVSKGITYFTLRSPRKEKNYITAEHFIPKVINEFDLRNEHLAPIIDLYKKVENKSSVLSRSNPQSVSCGIVFYYFKKINFGISASDFGKKVKLSDITVNRIANEVEEIIEATSRPDF